MLYFTTVYTCRATFEVVCILMFVGLALKAKNDNSVRFFCLGSKYKMVSPLAR